MGFLLEFHEKRFHSSRLVPLKFLGHGVLGDSQAQPSQSAHGLWASNECGNLLEEGLRSHVLPLVGF